MLSGPSAPDVSGVAEAGRGRPLPVVGREDDQGVELSLEIGHVQHRSSSGRDATTVPEQMPKRKRGGGATYERPTPFATISPASSPGGGAHRRFDDAVADLPAALRGGRRPDCRTRRGSSSSTSGSPSTTSSISAGIPTTRSSPGRTTTGRSRRRRRRPRAWDESLRRYREDRAALQALARDPAIDLTARIPHGTGQTYLREILLAIDHAAYHIGELIVVRRLLWVRGRRAG